MKKIILMSLVIIAATAARANLDAFLKNNGVSQGSIPVANSPAANAANNAAANALANMNAEPASLSTQSSASTTVNTGYTVSGAAGATTNVAGCEWGEYKLSDGSGKCVGQFECRNTHKGRVIGDICKI